MNKESSLKRWMSRHWVMPSMVALAAVLAWLPAVSGGFFWDTPSVFSGESVFTVYYEHEFSRPLFKLALAAERFLWGNSAFGYHIVNLLFHSLNSVLVYLIALRLFPGARVAVLAAFLFALHPAHVETVSWVLALPWLMGAFFSLCSFLLYLIYVRSRKLLALLAGALFALLAMLSCQATLVLPFFVVLCGWLMRVERNRRITGLLLYTIALGAYVLLFMGAGEFRPPAGAVDYGLLNSLSVLGFYVIKFIFPVFLPAMPLLPERILYTIAGLVPVAAGYFLYSESFKKEALTLGAMLMFMIPALFVASWARDFSVGYRFMYMPLIAFCIFVAQFITRIRSNQLFKLTTVILVAACVSGVLWHSVKWTDNTRLWAGVVNTRPNSVLPFLNLAATLAGDGRVEAAEKAIVHALVSDQVNMDHYSNIIRLYGSMGFDKGEERMYEALITARGQAHAEYALGFIYYQRFEENGRDKELLIPVIKHLKNAIDWDADLASAHYYLGIAYLHQKKDSDAFKEFTWVRDANMRDKHWADSVRFLTLFNGITDRPGLSYPNYDTGG